MTDCDDRIEAALQIAGTWADVDGAHHKAWCIDQMVRALTGCPMVQKTALDHRNVRYTYPTMGESEEYQTFVDSCGQEWDTGVAP